MSFDSLADVKRANKSIGECWFSKKTMSFFDSRIESSLYKNQCFLTSEGATLSTPTVRMYAVRYANPDGTIRTLERFSNKDDAKRFARSFTP